MVNPPIKSPLPLSPLFFTPSRATYHLNDLVLKVNYRPLPPYRCSVASINTFFFHMAFDIQDCTCTLRCAGERAAVEFGPLLRQRRARLHLSSR